MSAELYPELGELYEIIKSKRIKLGHPTVYTKQREITTFSGDIRFLVGMYGIIPYRMK